MTQAELLNQSLEQVITVLQDPTDAIFDLMYQRHPELRTFQRDDNSWQNYMIQEIMENLIYMMESPGVALSIIRDMTQHHHLIGVDSDTFKGLYTAIQDTVTPLLSGPDREAMIALWQDLVRDIHASIDASI